MTTEIKICMGSACFARGNYKNAEIIEKFIEDNNLDAKIELYGALCENKCNEGPRIYIDDVEYKEVTTEKLTELLNAIKK